MCVCVCCVGLISECHFPPIKYVFRPSKSKGKKRPNLFLFPPEKRTKEKKPRKNQRKPFGKY